MKQKILAIDFGTQRIGLAINHASLAEPLLVLKNDTDSVNKIKVICEQYQIELLLLGLSENEMAVKTQQFAQQLKTQIDLPLEFIDETLSSQQVLSKLKSDSIKKKKRLGPIDHFAAALFLEEYLDSH